MGRTHTKTHQPMEGEAGGGAEAVTHILPHDDHFSNDKPGVNKRNAGNGCVE